MALVLIVDDEPSVRILVRFMLEKDGHRVVEATNGQEALDRLGLGTAPAPAEMPGVVLLDVMMPVMDGVAAAKAIGAEPRTAGLPILIVSAKGDMRALFDGLPGVRGFFTKPFDPKTLREAVARALAEPRS